MRKTYCVLLLILILYVSCEKEISRYKFTEVSEEFKSIAFFNKDSYWIYKDSLTELYDTVYLKYSSLFYNLEYPKRPTYIFNSYLKSTMYSSQPQHHIIEYSYSIYQNIFRNAVDMYNLYRIHEPIDTVNRQSVQFVKKHDTYIIDTTLYKDVYMYKLSDDLYITDDPPGFNPSYRFYCRNIGLIRIESINTNFVRNIINYHVEPFQIN